MMTAANLIVLLHLAVLFGICIGFDGDTAIGSPIIGILTTPILESAGCVTFLASTTAYSDGSRRQISQRDLGVVNDSEVVGSCFHAWYPKWIEQGGGRSIPIKYDASTEEVDRILAKVNGVVFTGGELSLRPETKYFKTAKHIYSRTIEMNRRGIHFPLWGICMGFQLLCEITGGDYEVISHNQFDSEQLELPLEFTKYGREQSRMFSGAGDEIMWNLANLNITANLHHDGVYPSTFQRFKNLDDFYHVISENKDRKGTPFISSIEAKDYPIYAVQWHPERPQYDWSSMGIPHSTKAFSAMEYLSNFFNDEARKNSQTFSSREEEDDLLLYNTAPRYNGYNVQTYLFEPANVQVQ